MTERCDDMRGGRYGRHACARPSLLEMTKAVKAAETAFGDTIKSIQTFLKDQCDDAGRRPKVFDEVTTAWLHLSRNDLDQKLNLIREALEKTGAFDRGFRLSDSAGEANCMFHKWNNYSNTLWDQHAQYIAAIRTRGESTQQGQHR